MPPKKSNKEEPESCSICLDNYTSILRRKAICKYCKKDACSKCIERYLLERIEDAHCLHCRVNYDDDSLQEICTKTYLQNKYFKHRQEVLVNRERARLPGLQDQAVLERRKRDGQKQLNVLRGEWTELERKRDTALIEYNHAYTNFTVAKHNGESEEERNRLREILLAKTGASDELRKELARKRDEYYVLYSKVMRGDGNELATEEEIAAAGSAAAGSQEVEKKKFIRRCTRDNCQGFLSTAWKCGICEQWSCPECHELKGYNRDCAHQCDPNNVETAKMLAKDSKPCPKCQSMIFKVSGCDQMWCTQCHTAFSWNTGKLEKNIHNPHYYEWQRKNGGILRNPGDVECGRDLGHYTVSRIYDLVKKHSDLCENKESEYISWSSGQKKKRNSFEYSDNVNKICSIIRNIIHNNHAELPNFQTDYVIRNQDLRVKYLENIISEEEFKIMIQRNDKKNKKNNEIAQVLHLANTTVTDIVYRLMDNLEKSDNGQHCLETFLREFEEIISYCNDIFKDISFTYNTIQYGFTDTFSFVRVIKEKKGKKKDSVDEDSDDDDNSISLNQ
jgi:hypothetical protein